MTSEDQERLRSILEDVIEDHGFFGPGLHIDINSHFLEDTALHIMLWREDTENARFLIECGANVNAKGDMSETPLHVAVGKENIEMIKLLLKKGADVNIKSEFDRTPYEKAVAAGNHIVKLFEEEQK